MTAPRRRWRLKLELGADTFKDIVATLEQLATELDMRPGLPDGSPTRGMVSGGPTSGYVAEIDEDPSVTHESYFAAIHAAREAR